jgi:hypothetical protein
MASARRILPLSLAILLFASLPVGANASSAAAHSASNPAWGNLPPISKARGSSGDLVGFWQAILWADGRYNKCVSQYPNNSIDRYFGNNTDVSTKNWQSAAGLSADGSVGPLTWTKAYSRTTRIKGYGDLQWLYRMVYFGSAQAVSTHQWLASDPGWWEPKGEWHWLSPTWPSGGFTPRLVTGARTFYTC